VTLTSAQLGEAVASLDRDVPVQFAPYDYVLGDQVKTIHVFARLRLHSRRGCSPRG